MQGGAETGFKHVLPEEYRPRLLHFSGKRKIEVKEVSQMYKNLKYTQYNTKRDNSNKLHLHFHISTYQIICL